jgi:ankyrin repeat protein
MRVQLLLDQTLVRTARDRKGNTAAHLAAMYGQLKIFETIISHEPELLWTVNEVRNTPAHKAAEFGHVDILRCMNDRDPSLLSARGAMGASPMHFAAAKVFRLLFILNLF